MRTKWFVRAAVLAASLIGLTACEPNKILIDNENININPPNGTVVGSVTDTSGACIVRYDVYSSGSTSIPVDGQTTLTVFATANNPSCPVENDFQWEAGHGTSVVRVVSVNSVTGRVTGTAPGTDQVCAVSKPDREVSVCIDITVTGGTGPTLSINSITNVSSGNGCQRTFQGVLSIPGTPGTWSVSGITGATVNGSTGAGTVPQGSSGTLVLTFTPATGAAVSRNVTVVATDCTSNTCAVVSFNPTVPSSSLVVGGTQQITPNLTTNPAGCGTVTYVASGSVSVSSTGLVTGISSGTGTVTVTPVLNGVNGNSVTLTFNVTVQTVTANPSSISLANCTGFQVNWNAPVITANGTTVTGSNWLSSNTSVATVNNTTGAITLTGTAGTASITAQTSAGQVTIPVTVTQCPAGISVTVTPANWSLVVGQQPITLTATVSGTTSGQSTAVTWSIFTQNGGNCITLTPNLGTNTAVVQAIAGCGTLGNLTPIEVRATSVADPTRFGSSTGTTSSGNVTCTITWNGTTTGNITVAVNGTTTVIVSCTNQFGASFTPYWYAAKGTSVLSIAGTNGQVLTIGGVTFPSGTQATIRGTAAGTDVITAQAAITDVTALATRTVIVQ